MRMIDRRRLVRLLFNFVPAALASSMRAAGDWELNSKSIRLAHKALGARLDQAIVGDAITYLIFATVPSAVVSGSILYGTGLWLNGPIAKAVGTLAYTIGLAPPMSGAVLASWRIVTSTRRQPFMLRYGSRLHLLTNASKLGWLAAAIFAATLVLTGIGMPGA